MLDDRLVDTVNLETKGGKMYDIVFVKGNLINREVRIPKIIHSLAGNGFNITYIGWDRDNKKSDITHRDTGKNFTEVSFIYKAPWGYKILFHLPLWWLFIFKKLIGAEWDIVTAGDFISVPPAVLAGMIKGKPVIYDMSDVYEDQIVLPSIIRSVCIQIDKLFMRLASAVTLADESQIEEVNGIPNSKIVAIYDSPPDAEWKSEKDSIKNEKYTLFFAGHLVKSRRLNLDKAIEACKDLEGVQLIIAGYGDLSEMIQQKSNAYPEKIVFLGELSHQEVLEQSRNADLLFVLRDPIVPVNKYICGSKVLEAMMCGTPMLVNQGTSTARIVAREKFGKIVDGNNIAEIKEAIQSLMSQPNLCKRYSENARSAYENRYSWEIMRNKLLTLYTQLIEESRGKKPVRSQ